jgi:hypothetical protein
MSGASMGTAAEVLVPPAAKEVSGRTSIPKEHQAHRMAILLWYLFAVVAKAVQEKLAFKAQEGGRSSLSVVVKFGWSQQLASRRGSFM